jgi:hypothetical protein
VIGSPTHVVDACSAGDGVEPGVGLAVVETPGDAVARAEADELGTGAGEHAATPIARSSTAADRNRMGLAA